MAMKNTYDILDEPGGFDVDLLHASEIGVEIFSFREREGKGIPIIELGLKLFWTSNKDDEQHIGQDWKQPLFMGGENVALTKKVLRTFLRSSGFDLEKWVADSDTPPSVMIPAALKLLAWKHVPVLCRIRRADTKTGNRAFLDFVKVLREVPGKGEPYHDALPRPIPDKLVLEAYHVTGLEGDDFEFGAGGGGGGDGEIPV